MAVAIAAECDFCTSTLEVDTAAGLSHNDIREIARIEWEETGMEFTLAGLEASNCCLALRACELDNLLAARCGLRSLCKFFNELLIVVFARRSSFVLLGFGKLIAKLFEFSVQRADLCELFFGERLASVRCSSTGFHPSK